MNCQYHNQTQISFICISPHTCKCKRKLCAKCLFDHEVDVKLAVPIEIFQEKAVMKLKEFQLQQTTQSTEQKFKFKSILSQTQNILKQIWEELSQSINQRYDWIQKENNTYLELNIKNLNPAESSYTDLEKLVKIVEGTALKDWNFEKNQYMIMLEDIQNSWEKIMKNFIEKSNQVQKEIKCLINRSFKQNFRTPLFYESKEALSEILEYVTDIDEEIFFMIIENLKKKNNLNNGKNYTSIAQDQQFLWI